MYKMNQYIYPSLKELERAKSNTTIHALKLIVNCQKCGRRWSIWFEDQEDLEKNLPKDWYVCSTCRDANKQNKLGGE